MVVMTLRLCIFLLIYAVFLSLIFSIYDFTRYTVGKNGNFFIDNHTRCLLDMHNAFESHSIPWFIIFGTAIMYWRSKNFIGNDIDTGILYEDLIKGNVTDETTIPKILKAFNFRLRKKYGQFDHGQEWTFLCPRSNIRIDVFIVYPIDKLNKSSDYWAATYGSLCTKMIYKKCRWKFKRFNLVTFQTQGKDFRTVPLEFVIDRYGKDYMIPKKYSYHESLKILPNLIQEYANQSNTYKKMKKKLQLNN